MLPTAQDVLDFWLGDGLERGWCSDARDELWFGGGPELDASIQARFGKARRVSPRINYWSSWAMPQAPQAR